MAACATLSMLSRPPSQDAARSTAATTVLRPVVTYQPRRLATLAVLAVFALVPAAAASAETGGAGQVETGGNVSDTAFDRQGM